MRAASLICSSSADVLVPAKAQAARDSGRSRRRGLILHEITWPSKEGLGRKFQEAPRRATFRLRESPLGAILNIDKQRLAEIESGRFFEFHSLPTPRVPAKSTAKFLEVDVLAYLDAFETSGHLTVDGYS